MMPSTTSTSSAATPLVRRLLALVVVCSVGLGTLAGFAPAADAQTAVVGTADFRNAPQLVPGTYSDRIVTGDSAWYSLMYTNDTPYEFEVEVRGSAPQELDLTASFVAPTLTTIDGPSGTVSGNGVVYPSGTTNVWFLKVTLNTSGQPGVEYPVTISVDGVESAGLADCSDVPGCTLDDEYAALNVELADAQASLEKLESEETVEGVTTEIENLRGFAESSATLLPGAQARLAANEATMAQLCAPDPMCETFPDPGTKTPVLGWAIGVLAIGGGAFRAISKFRAEPEDDEPTLEPRPPSAIEKARRENAAKKKADKKAAKK